MLNYEVPSPALVLLLSTHNGVQMLSKDPTDPHGSHQHSHQRIQNLGSSVPRKKKKKKENKTPVSCQLRLTMNTIHHNTFDSFSSSRPSEIRISLCVWVLGLAYLPLNIHF